jgi:hypothetical protein
MSFAIIRADSEMLAFPVVAGVTSILFTIAMLFPTIVTKVLHQQHVVYGPLEYAVTFATYFGLAFIATFFNVCVVYTTKVRLEGGDATFMQSIAFAFSRIPQIFMWSLLAASVGLVLRSLDNAARKSRGIAGFLIGLIANLLGAAWSVLTLFVVPVMVYEGVGPFAAIGKSVDTLKKTWGESLIRHYGLGLVQFVLLLPAVLGFIGAIFGMSNGLAPGVGMAIIGVLILYIMAVALVFSVANSVFNTALYSYAATGKVPAGWSADTLHGAFRRK